MPNRRHAAAVVLAAAGAGAAAAVAAPEPAAAAPAARHSGLHDMSPALQALQRDDSQNPGLLAVAEGAALWRMPAGAAAESCAGCHGDEGRGTTRGPAVTGAAASYPAWDAASGRPLNLGQRIDACRTRHQQASPWAVESIERLSVLAWLGSLARGRPIGGDSPADARLEPWRARGEALWRQRLGQLNLACTQCHDQRAGQRLGGAVIPQGHPTGYPIYRLEWQATGSLERRLRGCVAGVRAEPWPPGADEWLALEIFLARRAAGLPVETPAVRP